MATLQQLRYLIAVAEYGSINAAAREDVSFRYTAEQGKTVTVTAKGAGPGTSQKTGRRNVTLYTTDNGYQYYTDTTSSGVTP